MLIYALLAHDDRNAGWGNLFIFAG